MISSKGWTEQLQIYICLTQSSIISLQVQLTCNKFWIYSCWGGNACTHNARMKSQSSLTNQSTTTRNTASGHLTKWMCLIMNHYNSYIPHPSGKLHKGMGNCMSHLPHGCVIKVISVALAICTEAWANNTVLHVSTYLVSVAQTLWQ